MTPGREATCCGTADHCYFDGSMRECHPEQIAADERDQGREQVHRLDIAAPVPTCICGQQFVYRGGQWVCSTGREASRSTPRQYLGSKVDGERSVRDLQRGRRATYFVGLPFRWVRIPRREKP